MKAFFKKHFGFQVGVVTKTYKFGNKGLRLVLLIVVLVVGIWIGKSIGPEKGETETTVTKAEAKPQWWTCSMHPAVKRLEPGLCPLCEMALIPLVMDETQADADMPRLTVSESAKKLMDIEVAPVERKFVDAVVRMTGKVDFDETNLAYITAWVPGRLDKLYVDYTGVSVNKGDHMVKLYSPELIGAQEELLQALEAVKNIQETELGIMREMTESTVKSVREKLRLWGVTPEQIAEIEKSGKVSDHMTIYAPTSGIVIHKNAQEGMYVQTGTKIYTIADLSKIWVKLDAYESDLQWLRYGQEMEFTTIAYPGQIFKGTISFIDPILNDRTRTVKIRVNVQNPDGKLKPGMFVKAIVRSQVAGGGRIMDAGLAGKWICPMHPEIIKEASGQCDTCQMPLVQTEDLGYISDDPSLTEKPLVIPVTAALVTGSRAIVYVQLPNTEKPIYEGREIALGPRAGDYYLVRSGLSEGELVVVKGNFKIDSSLQIMAKPSMMTPAAAGEEPATYERSGINDTFRTQLAKVFEGYFAMQQALADDKVQLATESAKKTSHALKAVDMKLLTGESHHKWMTFSTELESILSKAGKSEDIKLLRNDFYLLSQQLTKIAKYFGSTGQSDLYILYCPMAFDNKGGHWLQDNDQTANPYFGHMMLRCGGVEEVIGAKEIWETKE
ncbi:MAG: efflux RND transporter periplasmic adaptor subunit [Planctomycetes bacterium]|nr:efflux RND transporter periplasmic adaptor subunit [Planctomycetota bacterium]